MSKEKKVVKKNYWGDEQQQAVVDYNILEAQANELIEKLDKFDELLKKDELDLSIEESNLLNELRNDLPDIKLQIHVYSEEKNKIFNKYLRDPINTMTDSIIRRYKLFPKAVEYSDLHTDTISYLLTKIHKYDPNRVSEKTGLKTKAYSYIQTIIKHKLLANLQVQTRDTSRYTLYDDAYKAFQNDEKHSYTIDDQFDNSIQELIGKLVDYIEYVLEFSASTLSVSEVRVGNGLIDVFQNWKVIFEASDNNKLNKNAVLYSLREMLNMTTKEVRTNLKKYKSIYYLIKDKMIEDEEL